MAKGPLIPGMNDFDRPKKGLPRWVGLFIALSVVSFGLLTLWGFVAGGGPFAQLGQVERGLQPIGFRPTVQPNVIQIQVQLPKEGACSTNTFEVLADETPEAVSIVVELLNPRDNSCPGNQLTGESWLDLTLTEPLSDRLLIRGVDGQELPQVG